MTTGPDRGSAAFGCVGSIPSLPTAFLEPAEAKGRGLATPLPILTTVTSGTVERRSVLDCDEPGVRAVRDRRRILAGETRENTMNDKRARELVARERARIEQSLRELNAEVTAEAELHQQQTGEASEAGTDLEREEIDIALVADLREELKAVGRAEARIAAGKYGRSIDTGAQIPDERLEAAPLAERTIEEQRRLENGVV